MRQRAEDELVAGIRVLYAASRGAYGAPRIQAALARAGRRVNRKKIERLMREHRVCGITRRRRRADAAGAAGGVRRGPRPAGLHRIASRDAAGRRHDRAGHRRGQGLPGNLH
ncbi:IS3 family transposase [Streptomyces sp. NPDC059262]|uniref:IS3 family transposase n=1 Tax=Streptomyces sp. NPDC059262 TaxID=3346797 RepID=UPI00368AD87A